MSSKSIAPERKCPSCCALKPLSEYHVGKGSCKQCISERRKRRYHSDADFREKLRQRWNESYRRNGLNWPSKNRDRLNEYHRKRRADPEINKRIKRYGAVYRERYRLRCLARAAAMRAKRGGIEYDAVFLKEIGELRPETCACCGERLDYRYGSRIRGSRPHPRCPSLDRIDPDKGYVRGNVAIICWRCNAIKRDGTLDEMVAIVNYMRSRLT